MSEKEKKIRIRREMAFWQALAVGFAVCLMLLTVCAIAAWSHWSGERQELKASAADWEERYLAAKAIEQDAVAAYGEKVAAYERLVDAIDQEYEMQRQQAKAYEALGEYQYIGICTLTAYCCETKGNPHICGDGDGLTATGLPVAPGMVAVDPKVIPLGSTVIINGTSYLAADTGVSGYHIDIAIQTHEEADRFGVSSAEVWIIPPGGDGNAER